MIHCFTCNIDVSDDMTFCTNCGEKLVRYGNDFVIPNRGRKADDEVETVIRPAAEQETVFRRKADVKRPLFESFSKPQPKKETSRVVAKWIAGTLALAILAVMGIVDNERRQRAAANAANVQPQIDEMVVQRQDERQRKQQSTPEARTPVVPPPTPKQKPRYTPEPANRNLNRANLYNSGPAYNIPPPRIMEFDRYGRRLRAICKNGEPSYWQFDKWATCGMNGGVLRWNPNHPKN